MAHVANSFASPMAWIVRESHEHQGELGRSLVRLIVAVLLNPLVTSPLPAQLRGACLASSPGVSQVRDAIANLVSSGDTLAVRYRAEKNLPVVKRSGDGGERQHHVCARLLRARSNPLGLGSAFWCVGHSGWRYAIRGVQWQIARTGKLAAVGRL